MEDSRTIYCGNLSKDVTEELLYELFLQAGPIERVNIPKDKQGNRRNFGFIVFKHDISVNYAIALMSGEKLFGQLLRLQSRANNAESSPEINHQGRMQQKTLSCPPGFSFGNNRNGHGVGNIRQGSSRSNNDEDVYRNYHQVPVTQQQFSPTSPVVGYPPNFANSPMPQPNFVNSPVGLPLIPDPFGVYRQIMHVQYQQQNWPVRGNRWMRN